jgi:hypothetical protein
MECGIQSDFEPVPSSGRLMDQSLLRFEAATGRSKIRIVIGALQILPVCQDSSPVPSTSDANLMANGLLAAFLKCREQFDSKPDEMESGHRGS